jgi:outer membrane murein-binding lipoprotein Lpp
MRTLYIIAPCLLLAGCGIFNPQQVESIVSTINTIESQGALTSSQAEALRQAVMANTGEPWWIQIGRVALEVGLAVVGVRLWRGPSATTDERLARAGKK